MHHGPVLVSGAYKAVIGSKDNCRTTMGRIHAPARASSRCRHPLLAYRPPLPRPLDGRPPRASRPPSKTTVEAEQCTRRHGFLHYRTSTAPAVPPATMRERRWQTATPLFTSGRLQRCAFWRCWPPRTMEAYRAGVAIGDPTHPNHVRASFLLVVTAVRCSSRRSARVLGHYCRDLPQTRLVNGDVQLSGLW